jgi:dolichol-phosphate mannosyltransferase
MYTDRSTQDNFELSVVIPFYNEEESLQAVCEEVVKVLSAESDLSWEMILVNDGSSDGTAPAIKALCSKYPNFKGVHLQKNGGQSAALQAGFLTARGTLIATLDGDGQNDPHDLPHLIQALNERNLDMMCGIRMKREDNLVRKVSSRLANRVRAAILQDQITDVGCSLRIFRRECFERVPFFRNAHRFFPALFQMANYKVDEIPVNHRVRNHGKSKYGGGINSRLWVGLVDLAGAFWLKKRALNYQVKTEDND